ncbi:hypothetical protein ACLOJK_036073 [Asimina triloba]
MFSLVGFLLFVLLIVFEVYVSPTKTLDEFFSNLDPLMCFLISGAPGIRISINPQNKMAARGRIPYEGHTIQAPGMMRHGPFPGLGPAAGHRPLEVLPPDRLENKTSVQAAEAERLLRENQRLAASHVALRQELVASQKELQGLQVHIGSIQTESDIQVRGLLEKNAKMEADLRAGESLKKDLEQAHKEAQSLLTERQELNAQIQQANEELQKIRADVKRLPEMHAELDGLRQEHQRLRSAFEYEKGLNMEQVAQMQAMEKNLITMAREIEKLRAEVLKAEKRALAPNTYGSAYASVNPPYLPVAHSGGYADAYGRPQAQISGGATGEGMTSYGNNSSAGGGSGYQDGYGRPQVQMSAGAVGESIHPYGGSSYVDAYGRPQQIQMGGVTGEGMNLYPATSGSSGWAGVGAPPPPPLR